MPMVIYMRDSGSTTWQTDTASTLILMAPAMKDTGNKISSMARAKKFGPTAQLILDNM